MLSAADVRRFVFSLLITVVGVLVPADDPSRAQSTSPAPAPDVIRILGVGGLPFLLSPLLTMPTGELDAMGTAGACPLPDAPLDRVLYRSLEGRGAALSCGNACAGFLSFPQDEAGLTEQPDSPLGGFEAVAQFIRAAQDEVPLSTTVWDDGDGSPGAPIARAVADRRRDLHSTRDGIRTASRCGSCWATRCASTG